MTNKVIVFETKNFIVDVPQKPLVSREDGGHIRIIEKHNLEDRLLLAPAAATELAWLTMLVGEAFKSVMIKSGVRIERLNYQDNGNWCYLKNEKPHLHVHIFGRTFESKAQPLPNAMHLPLRSSGFYDNFNPLTENEIQDLKAEIKRLLCCDKYNTGNWKFNLS